MTRTLARACGHCGRQLKGARLEAAVYSRHTGSYYCGPRERCRKPRVKNS